MTTLHDARVTSALERMYAESDAQRAGIHDRFRAIDPQATAQERADAVSDIYMPITPDAGRLLYTLVRAARPATIVEFGMSFGLSTVHLAAAIRDNGTGRVITTELSAAKIAAASRTFDETGLSDLITVLEGDAVSTLAEVAGPVDLVLMDGWKELYLPVLRVLEPKLSAGALVIADNTEMADAKPYLDYVRNPANGYTSINFAARDTDSMEISGRA